MTEEDVRKRIKRILEECKEDNENDDIAMCYITPYDADALHMAVKILEQEPCEDCISREQAKWAIRDRFKDLPSRVEINTILNELPSVTPTPCDDAVSRKAVLNTLDSTDKFLDETRTVENYKDLLKDCYNDLPFVIQTQRKGYWIFDDKAHEHAHCSECGYGNVDLFNGRPHNYCPSCGAKMEE